VLALAVAGLRARVKPKPYSDTEIGMALGYEKEFARQEVHRRFGSRNQADDRRQNSYTGPGETEESG